MSQVGVLSSPHDTPYCYVGVRFRGFTCRDGPAQCRAPNKKAPDGALFVDADLKLTARADYALTSGCIVSIRGQSLVGTAYWK